MAIEDAPELEGRGRIIRLTVMYNLAPDQDEEEFLKWRLGPHQESNLSMPGVLRTDFSRIEESWPPGIEPKHRFVTTADWPDMESFRQAFYDPQAQEALKENLRKLSDPVFFICEVLINQEN